MLSAVSLTRCGIKEPSTYWTTSSPPMLSSTIAVSPGLRAGRRAPRRTLARRARRFLHIRINIDDIFAADDKVVVRWSSHGTHRGEMQGIPPTNRPMTMTGMAIYRFAGGKIVEEWMNNDTLGMLRQLGVIPG
jgi:predicted ester cyclase